MGAPKGSWREGKGYGAVVSDAPEDGLGHGPGTVEAYGGYLVAESVPTHLRPTIAAVPEMAKLLERVLGLKAELLESAEAHALVTDIETLLRKAGIRG